ncbi:MAG: PepSY domain-containing protein [Acidobacteria bacterium]|nr:PepSY domain-containing protein [Acidobacteriota bacterium]
MSEKYTSSANQDLSVEDLAEATGNNPSQALSRLYRVIWRWHFYAGLIVLPVLVVVALTGALLVFREELERNFDAAMLTVEPQPQRVTYDVQLANAAQTAPSDARATAMVVRGNPTLATQFAFFTKDGRNLNIFVNPYTGVVQGSFVYGDSAFDLILFIHRRLVGGTIGRIVVELATSWGIILAITGLYLWWPRGREKVFGVLLPRVRGKRYLVWRDWHVVPGFYVSVLAILVMATGLFYTMLFGRNYQKMMEVTKSNPPSQTNPPKSIAQENNSALPLDEVIAIIQRTQPEPEFYLDLPNKKDDSFYVYAGSSDHPSTLSQFYVDQYSGKVMGVTSWQQLSVPHKIQLMSYPIHVGSLYGWPTKILALLVCLLIVTMGVTGITMWWIRRPAGKPGFPQKPKDVQAPKWLIMVIALLGLLMPAAGISMLAIITGQWLGQMYKRHSRRN